MFYKLNRVVSYSLCMLSIALLASCLDPIELDVPQGESEAVVIEGKLTKGNPSSISVKVQRIFAFDGTSSVLKINGVSVITEDGQVNTLDKDADGEFSQEFGSDAPFDIEVGESYKLRVELFDGRVVESEFEELQGVGANDTAEFSVQNRQFFSEDRGDFVTQQKAIVDLNSTISNIQQSPARYRWFVQRTFKLTDSPDAYLLRDPENRAELLTPKTCYVTDDVSFTNLVLFDGFTSGSDAIEFEAELFDGLLNDYRFTDTMFFAIVQEGLSEGAFNYFDQISELLGRTGSMFESPAGKVVSNFVNVDNPDDEVFGYFYATDQKKTRLRITPDMLGENVPQPLCPAPTGEGWRPGQCPFLDCCDCSALPASSLIRPEFFQ